MDKKSFIRSGEGSIASYDYVDIDDGAGYVVYYGCHVKDDNTTDYILTRETMYSNATGTQYGHSPGNVTVFDNTYDVTMNYNKHIKGVCFTNLGVLSAGNGGTISVQITISHYDGTTTTQLSDETTAQALTVGVPKTYCMRSAAIDQLFGIGDTLQIYVKIWVSSSGGNSTLYTGHDPANRAYAGLDFSTISFHIPFRIDL